MDQSQIQQGDVLLWKVDGVPKGATRVKRETSRLILDEGEVSGHYHAIDDPRAELFTLNNEIFVEVKTDFVTLTHDEHKPLQIPGGVYQLGKVREYDHLQDLERRVVD